MCRVSSARAASDGLHMTSSAIHSARFRTLLAAEEGGEQGNAFGAQPNSDSPTTATPLVTPTSGKKSGAEMSSVTGKESIAFVSPRSDVGNGASTDRSVREHISLTATEKLTSVWACVHRRLAHAWDEVVIAKRNMVNRWQLRDIAMALGCVTLWAGSSTTLIMLNKTVLRDIGFRYPAIISTMGQACSFTVVFVMRSLGYWRSEGETASSQVTPYFYMTHVMPIGLFMGGTLVAGNAAYLYLPVSFVQMLKAFSPAVTMLVLIGAGMERVTRKLSLALLVITIGTFVSAWGEVSFSWIGTGVMMISMLMEAFRLAATQNLLTNLKFSTMEGILYLCPAATLWSAAYIAMTEGPVMVAKGDYVKMVQHPIPFMLSATLGVVVTISAMGVIKYMSSLTFKVLGQARNLGVILLSVYIFQNVVTLVQVTGYLVQIGGFQLYQTAKAELAQDKALPSMASSVSFSSVKAPLSRDGGKAGSKPDATARV